MKVINLKRPLSLLLSFSLIWSCGSGAEALLAIPQVFAGPVFLPQIELQPPPELGRISDYHNASDGGPRVGAKNPLVIIVQDLHAHYGVQKNIAALLEFFSHKLPPIKTASGEPFALAVEGEEGPIDTSLMALFPDPDIKRQSLDYLMREGELTGMEYFAAMHNHPALLVGVENNQYYHLHRDLFRKTYANRALMLGALHGLQKDIQDLRDTTYQASVKSFLKKEDAYERGTLSSDAYLGYLVYEADSLRISLDAFPKLYAFAKNAGLTERLHTASVIPDPAQLREWTLQLLKSSYQSLLESERRTLAVLSKNNTNYIPYYLYIRDLIYNHQLFFAVPGGLAKYLEYLHVVQTSGLDSVLEESHELAFQIQRGLAQTQNEKNLAQVEHDLALLVKITDLQATEGDVHAFAPRLNQFVAMGKALLNPTGAQPGRFDEAAIRRMVSSSIDFYAMALIRNKPMIDHTLALTPSTVVLVAGGFHTAQMTQLLKARGASYIVVTPSVNEITPEQHELYVKRLNGNLLSTDEIISAALTESESAAHGGRAAAGQNGIQPGIFREMGDQFERVAFLAYARSVFRTAGSRPSPQFAISNRETSEDPPLPISRASHEVERGHDGTIGTGWSNSGLISQSNRGTSEDQPLPISRASHEVELGHNGIIGTGWNNSQFVSQWDAARERAIVELQQGYSRRGFRISRSLLGSLSILFPAVKMLNQAEPRWAAGRAQVRSTEPQRRVVQAGPLPSAINVGIAVDGAAYRIPSPIITPSALPFGLTAHIKLWSSLRERAQAKLKLMQSLITIYLHRKPRFTSEAQAIMLAASAREGDIPLALVPKTVPEATAAVNAEITAVTVEYPGAHDAASYEDFYTGPWSERVMRAMGFTRAGIQALLAVVPSSQAIARQIERLARALERQPLTASPADRRVGQLVAGRLRSLRTQNEDLLPPSVGTRLTRRLSGLIRNKYFIGLSTLVLGSTRMFGATFSESAPGVGVMTVTDADKNGLGETVLAILKEKKAPKLPNGHYSWKLIRDTIHQHYGVSYADIDANKVIVKGDTYKLLNLGQQDVHNLAHPSGSVISQAGAATHPYAPSAEVLNHRFDHPGVTGPTIDVHEIGQSGWATAGDFVLGAVVAFAVIRVFERYILKRPLSKGVKAFIYTSFTAGFGFGLQMVGPHNVILPALAALVILGGTLAGNRLFGKRAAPISVVPSNNTDAGQAQGGPPTGVGPGAGQPVIPPLAPVAPAPPVVVIPEHSITVEGWGELDAAALVQKIKDIKFRGTPAQVQAQIDRLKNAVAAFAAANPAHPKTADVVAAVIRKYAFASGRYEAVYRDILMLVAPVIDASLLQAAAGQARAAIQGDSTLDEKRQRALTSRIDDLMDQLTRIPAVSESPATLPAAIAPEQSISVEGWGEMNAEALAQKIKDIKFRGDPAEVQAQIDRLRSAVAAFVAANLTHPKTADVVAAVIRKYAFASGRYEAVYHDILTGVAPVIDASLLQAAAGQARAAIQGDSALDAKRQQVLTSRIDGLLDGLAHPSAASASADIVPDVPLLRAQVKSLVQHVIAHPEDPNARAMVRAVMDHYSDPAEDDVDIIDVYVYAVEALGNAQGSLVSEILAQAIADARALPLDEENNPRFLRLQRLLNFVSNAPATPSAPVAAKVANAPIAAAHQESIPFLGQMVVDVQPATTEGSFVVQLHDIPQNQIDRWEIGPFTVTAQFLSELRNAKGIEEKARLWNTLRRPRRSALPETNNVIEIRPGDSQHEKAVSDSPVDFAVGQVWVSKTGARLRIVEPTNAGIRLTIGYSHEYAEDGVTFKGRFARKGDDLRNQDYYVAGQEWSLEQFVVGNKSYRVEPSEDGEHVMVIPFTAQGDEIGKIVNPTQFHGLVTGDLKWEQVPNDFLRNDFAKGEVAAMGLTGLSLGDRELYHRVVDEMNGKFGEGVERATDAELSALLDSTSQVFQTLSDAPGFEYLKGRTLTARLANADSTAPAHIAGRGQAHMEIEYNTRVRYSLDVYRVGFAHEISHVVIHEEMRWGYETAARLGVIGRWIVTPLLERLEEILVVWRARLFRRAFQAGLRRVVTGGADAIYATPAGNPAMTNDDVNDLVAGVQDPATRRQLRDALAKNRSFLQQA